MWRTDSLEKTLMLGKIEGGEKGMAEDEVVGRHHQLDGHESEQVPGVGDRDSCCPAACEAKENWTRLNDWAELSWTSISSSYVLRGKSLQQCPTATLWAIAQRSLLSMGFSRQEYWNGLLCPPMGHLPNPGTQPASPALLGVFFSSSTISTTWEALLIQDSGNLRLEMKH